jgi:hypothetical protein
LRKEVREMGKRLRPLALCLAFLLLAALVAGGCGKQEGGTDGGDQQDVFDASRLPGIGSTYEYFVNAPLPAESQGIPVNFALESSWDLSSGPTDAITKVSIVSPAGMPGTEMFPDADLCFRSEAFGDTVYTYYLQDNMARRLMGSYIASGEGAGFWEKYEPPKTILRFPVELPATEPVPEDVTHTTSGGFSEVIRCLSAVRWIDTVKVPAGEFPDTAMVQYFDVHANETGNYSEISYAWYAPDVGQVAFVGSFPEESQPAFNRAVDLRRLASYQAVK